MSPTGCDPDVYHHYGLPATDCANCSSPTPSAEPEGTTRSGVSMVFDHWRREFGVSVKCAAPKETR